ncbi:MAG: tetratricopeptide repeat protein [Lachnospiraceae bacterium]|nr:tetratricopeptide repeat protein [Lachnospiraceae bacterium]
MKKKISGVFLFAVLLLGLTACGRSVASQWQEQYDLGEKYLLEEDYEAAIVAFTAAIEIDPKQTAAYIGRGDAYIQSGETEENLTLALVDYEAALELDATVAAAYLGIADVYVRQGDYEAAEAILRQGLEATGNDTSIQERLDEITEVAIEDGGGSSEWDGSVAEGFAEGSGTEDDPWQISTAGQLAYLAESVNSGESYGYQYYILMADLNLAGIEWTPIGTEEEFRGEFDGNGHTIQGLYITAEYEYTGLFGQISYTEASISNLTLDGYISAVGKRGASIGMLVGEYSSSYSEDYIHVRNCVVSGTIEVSGYEGTSSGNVGGVLGTGMNVDFADTYCSVNITGNGITGRASNGVGGLIGSFEYSTMPSQIVSCSYSGSIAVTSTDGAGILNIGGIFGHVDSGDSVGLSIQQCYNSGTLTYSGSADGTLGGIIGDIAVGCVADIYLSECYNEGVIDSQNTGNAFALVGGIIGENYSFDHVTILSGCYNTGSVSAYAPSAGIHLCTGGLIGWDYYAADLEDCYNVGQVSAGSLGTSEYVGDLIGRSSGDEVISD